MRRSEITKELIELSKRAKELGFPQNVEEGDWVFEHDYVETKYCLRNPSVSSKGTLRDKYTDGIIRIHVEADYWFLILEFSRCLEWLENKSKGEMIGLDLNNFIHGHWIMGIKTKTYRGKNIHEVGAKAVVMKLEENNA